tara:strand:- start:10627 stop:10884 length:258 start_codon:yes stop_codon:yes gene_type:complete
MINKPRTKANLSITQQSFSKKAMKGKVSASNFEWKFTWAFEKGELHIEPPLGRALIKDALERFLIKADYKLEPGGDYSFTIRAKF